MTEICRRTRLIPNQNIQAERIKSALTTTEFVAQGNRSSIIVLVSGTATYFADEIGHTALAPCLIWSPTRHPARLSVAAGSRGFVLRAPEKTISQAMPTGPISAQVRKTLASRLVLSSLSPEKIAKYQNQFEMIEGELFAMAPGALSVIHHCLSLALIEIWRNAKPSANYDMALRPQQIADDFLHLVEVHLQSHSTVEEYAQRIGVSRDRLNSAVRRVIGTSPNQHIQVRLMEEAKSLLLHSNLSVGEIAYRLGFSDAAYFNRFFQRHAKLAPGRFRRKNLDLRRSTSNEAPFAAWP